MTYTFFSQVAAGAWLYQNLDQFEAIVKSSVASTIQSDYGKEDVKTKAFNVMQREVGGLQLLSKIQIMSIKRLYTCAVLMY